MTRAALTPNAWLRYDHVRRFLADFEDQSSFLEIGCGQGALATHLVGRFEYVAYEPDVASYEVARARVAGLGTVHNDFLPEVPDRTFDLVGAFEVLEHIEYESDALASWRRWVKPGGWLLLSVPAGPGRFGACDRKVGHFRRYTRPDLTEILDQTGFAQISIQSCGFPLGYALEWVRNLLAGAEESETKAELTAASGRYLQPAAGLASFTKQLTAPFRVAQWPFRQTDIGTGFVAFAQNPSAS